MRWIVLLVAVLAFVVTSCEQPPEYLSATQINATVRAAVATAQAAMRTPSLTGTITWTPSPSATGTRTLSATPTATWTLVSSLTPAPARSLTPTPTFTATLTPLPFKGNTVILGCDIGLDITHGMGEVTNAYVRLRNQGDADLAGVCLMLGVDNEGRVHPDKTRCLSSLRSNFEVTLKLTVDTDSRQLTSATVAVMTVQGVIDRISAPGCRLLSSSELNQIKSILNVPRAIQ
jgi:hypothetical protein